MDISIRIVIARKRNRQKLKRGKVAPAPLPTGLTPPTDIIEEPGRRIYKYTTPPTSVFIKLAKASGARVELLFWGDFWRTALKPSVSDITQAVSDVISSPYLSELQQYGIGSITLGRATIVLQPGPNSPTYSSEDVKDMVWDLIDGDVFPEPDEDGGKIAYLVFAPPGTV